MEFRRIHALPPYAFAEIDALKMAARRADVDVIDLGFGVLTLPVGEARRLLDEVLPADVHYLAVSEDDDPDLATS